MILHALQFQTGSQVTIVTIVIVIIIDLDFIPFLRAIGTFNQQPIQPVNYVH